MRPPVIPHDELLAFLRGRGWEPDAAMYRLAREVEQEVLARIDRSAQVAPAAASAFQPPLADHEVAFINDVREVVRGIRESILQEERERLAREIPDWLRKGNGPASGGTT